MLTSQTLLQLTLDRMPLEGLMITDLCDAIKQNKSLAILRITACTFATARDFEELADSLCVNDSVETLELCNDFLNEDASSGIKGLINTHAKRRSELFWISELRGSKRRHNMTVKGLLHLNLSDNELDDKFITNIIPALQFDQFLRVIFDTIAIRESIWQEITSVQKE